MRASLWTMLLFLFVTPVCAVENTSTDTSIIIQSPEDYANTAWAKSKIPAGTKLITYKDSSGVERHRLEFKGGVTMTEVEGGTLSMDDHSAVLCGHEMVVFAKNYMEVCHPDDTHTRDNIDRALAKFDAFIISNSLSPVTQEELTQFVQKRREGIDCADKEKQASYQKMISMSDAEKDKLEKSIDDTLAVPRPPVMNPCM